MNIEHVPVLFTTTEHITSQLFRNYGFRIDNGQISLHHIDEFSRANYKTDNWKRREVYHYQVHRNQDAPQVPNAILQSAKCFLTGFILNQL